MLNNYKMIHSNATNKIKKIAYISTLKSVPWGGSEELWFQSAREALKKNIELGIFIYNWDDTPKQILELINKGAKVFKRRRKDTLISRLIVKFINQLIKKKPLSLNPYYDLITYNPDIIIITDGATYYTADDNDLSFMLLNYFKNKFIIICQGNSQSMFPSNRSKTIELFENSLKVLFVSEHNRQLAFHQLAYNLTKTSTIQNPVLLKDFNRIPFPKIDNCIHCAVIGRYSISEKGQDILISMMALEYWKNINIKLHLYGSGQDEDYLRKLINFYGVSEKVTIEGFFNDKNEIWHKCHCLLMCSHGEGTSLAMLEALVAGRVCVITKVGGSEEWIDDGITGFLVDAPTQQLFSDKLKELILRKNDLAQIASAAHEFALQRLDYSPGKTLLKSFI
jgi:glycosyltransferase involved in cell wall biosynthesis